MEIKKANVNLLLGKVGDLLKKLPVEVKKGAEFAEAEKALAKLQELFTGLDGEIELKGCRGDQHILN